MVNDLHLTPRERDVLLLVATGATALAISRELGMAPETVKHHVKNLLGKLRASDRQHAVRLALEAGLIRRDELA